MFIFHRPIRDFLPDINISKTDEEWGKVITSHQKARGSHLSEHQGRLNEHTRRLQQLHVGDKVFIQNQVGPAPTKWDHTGVIIEVRQFDQYMVKMDHSGRHSLRNRKYLRLWKSHDETSQREPTSYQMPSSPEFTMGRNTEDQPITSRNTDPSIPPTAQATVPTQDNEPHNPPTSINQDQQPEDPARRSQRTKQPPDRPMYHELGNPK